MTTLILTSSTGSLGFPRATCPPSQWALLATLHVLLANPWNLTLRRQRNDAILTFYFTPFSEGGSQQQGDHSLGTHNAVLLPTSKEPVLTWGRVSLYQIGGQVSGPGEEQRKKYEEVSAALRTHNRWFWRTFRWGGISTYSDFICVLSSIFFMWGSFFLGG